MTLTVACGFVWDGKCHAWGTTHPTSHGCRFDPGHDGEHRCACGTRYREAREPARKPDRKMTNAEVDAAVRYRKAREL